MIYKRISQYSSSWGRRLNVLLVAALMLPFIGVAPAQAPGLAQNVQPLLLQMAAEQPEAMVSVIVQKANRDSRLEELVSRLGGTVTSDLHIINAFAAELPGKAIPQLAQAHDLRWVSYNSPVSTSATGMPAMFTTWAGDLGTPMQASIGSNFNGTAIAAGRTIWFSSIISNISGLGTKPVKVKFDSQVISFTANGVPYSIPVPDAEITFDPAATTVTTSMDATRTTWLTRAPSSYGGNRFLAARMFKLPVALPGGINPVTWSGRFTSDAPGITVQWKWAAAVYTQFNPDYNQLGVKPSDSNKYAPYLNSDPAGTPENYKSYVTGGARGGGGSNYVGGYSGTTQTAAPTSVFADSNNIVDSRSGPNGTFGYGNNVKQVMSGFVGEKTPGNAITKVEVVFKAYVPVKLLSTDVVKLSVSVGGTSGAVVSVPATAFDATCCTSGKAMAITVDLTGSRAWKWSDFDKGKKLALSVDQSAFNANSKVYYDAIGLRVTSASGTDTSGGVLATSGASAPVDTSRLVNVYNGVVRATNVWNDAQNNPQGQGMVVAVVDSGYYWTQDVGRMLASVNLNAAYHSYTDQYGHGTFVDGIISGDGTLSAGAYMGIAPQSSTINVRVADDQGMATEVDVVNALQWVYDNRGTYNIRVVNLSMNAGVWQSYNTSPLDAACEILWFNGIVVVTSAGNNGTATLFPPANDPFVITVGATDDLGTPGLSDDVVASFSAYGTDEVGHTKPDLVAPGKNIIAPLADNSNLTISVQHPDNRVNSNYFRMSGTSMSAPMVSGAVALLLQDEPNLNPDQVKYRLKATANKTWAGYNATRAGAGYLDIYAAVKGTTTQSANTGIYASHLLDTGNPPVSQLWGSAQWGSAQWGSAQWGSAQWGSAQWGSAQWGSDYWGP